MHTGLFRMYHYGSHKWEDYLLDIQEAQKGVSKKHRREFRDREFRDKGVSGQGSFGTDEVTPIKMPRLRSIDVVRPRTNYQLSTKRKCLLLLALIGFLLRSGFLRRQPAFGLFFQHCGELL